MGVTALPQSSQIQHWDTRNLASLELIIPFCGTLNLSSHDQEKIHLSYRAEGEYQEHMGIHTTHEAQHMELREFRNPLLLSESDKLAAHKIIASELELTVPTRFIVSLQMKNGRMHIQGRFKRLRVQLEEGSGKLQLEQTPGEMQTAKASVNLYHSQMFVRALTPKRSFDCGDADHADQFLIHSQSGTIRCYPN